MSTSPTFNFLLALPRIKVQNANAISSPLTHGFPAITAFMGMMWALERKTRAAGLDIAFKGIGVVCHHHQEHAHGSFIKAFHLTRNPVSKDGSTAAIVEEGRMHLEVSLILALDSERWRRDEQAQRQDIATIQEMVGAMRIAGGSVMPVPHPGLYRYQPQVIDLTGAEEDRLDAFQKLRLRLLPGFALVSRDDLLDERLAELQEEAPDKTRLDAWLSLARINWRYDAESQAWQHDRHALGWIVPIPVGYGALSELQPAGSVANARDGTTPFQFVESLFSVGEWVSPHRLEQAEQLIWYPHTDTEAQQYRCRNDYRPVNDPFEHLYDFS